ncbi:MAG: hypothetical protein ACT4PW_01535 [Acidimicrobiia bacterium]
MFTIVAAFGPTDEITAVFYLVAVICLFLAAFSVGTTGRFPGGGLGLIALGLGLWLFPTMWTTFDAAF